MGRRVKRREAKELSQRALATKAKVTQGLIHQKAVGVPVTELLG
jgi:hypothetical protein